jgi:hypothetical protein
MNHIPTAAELLQETLEANKIKPKRKPKVKPLSSQELKGQLEAHIHLGIAAICQTIHEESGQLNGQIECPRCRTHPLNWEMVDGTIRTKCIRKFVVDGTAFNCVDNIGE